MYVTCLLHISYPNTEVKELEQYWYKPNYTREEAVDIISHAEPGSFIVRDSQSVMRGYALTIKVSEIIIRRKLKVPPGVCCVCVVVCVLLCVCVSV